MSLYLDLYAPTLAVGCCPNSVGVCVFNEQHRALREISANNWQLDDYVKSSHDDFVIRLSEHAERTFFYSINLDSGNFTLPKTPDGEYYYLEFWHHEDDGTDFNRSIDNLLEHRRFIWDGSKRVDAKLGQTQVNELSIYEAHVSLSYDADAQTVYVLAWLEKNKQIVTDSISCNVKWHDRLGNTIMDVNQTTFMPNVPGVYLFDVTNIDPDPDLTTPIEVEVTDAASVVHKTLSSIVTWD